jgi:hypothetical protein
MAVLAKSLVRSLPMFGKPRVKVVYISRQSLTLYYVKKTQSLSFSRKLNEPHFMLFCSLPSLDPLKPTFTVPHVLLSPALSHSSQKNRRRILKRAQEISTCSKATVQSHMTGLVSKQVPTFIMSEDLD